MLIDYRVTLSDAERNRLDAMTEALQAVEPEVQRLLNEHRATSRRWYPHEIIPWGRGKDFNEIPWDPEQNTLRPEVVVALETNLLTEDNLPYYHAKLEQTLTLGGPFKEWTQLWTSEEDNHATCIRDYLHLMRVMDPREIEENRLKMVQAGFERHFADPFEIFAYTAAQELATRISHLRAGQRADEPIILKILTLIARDENFHFVFYRSVAKALIEVAPELMLIAIANQLYSFEMPGTGMTNFELRKATIADAGIYGAREHRDMVIAPLLRYWDLDKLTGLSPEAEKTRDRILRLENVLTRMVERQERRARKTD